MTCTINNEAVPDIQQFEVVSNFEVVRMNIERSISGDRDIISTMSE